MKNHVFFISSFHDGIFSTNSPATNFPDCKQQYGYARVSTDDQSTALQIAALRRAGCKTLFKDEGLSGATTKRPACAEADGLGHCKGHRLGLYLAHGFLRRRATVGPFAT